MSEAKKEQKSESKQARSKVAKVRNRGIRAVTLIDTEGKSVFVGPKATVDLKTDQVSDSMREQAKAGDIALEE